MGEASGIILEAEDKKIYHAGDTALFSDMRLFAKDKYCNELEWLFWDLSKRLLVAHPLVPSCNYRQLVRTA
jgi:hypothetical protein